MAAKRYRVGGGKLDLLGADGAVLATLAKQARDLAGTAWKATGINNGKGAVVSVAAGSTVSLAFGADGRASGSAGCNNFTAGYTVDGSSLRFGPAAATRKMCPEADVMEQEASFLKALESVSTARVEADRLELRTTDGALAATLVRPAVAAAAPGAPSVCARVSGRIPARYRTGSCHAARRRWRTMPSAIRSALARIVRLVFTASELGTAAPSLT
jgi:heat shock protein HslJ